MLINIIMSCHNICPKYKAEIDGKLSAQGYGAYLQGFKRCNTCNIFLTKEGVTDKGLCLCCKFRISTSPKRKVSRLKLRDEVYRVNFV
jgi:hypothetical protein